MDKKAFESLSNFELGKNYDGLDKLLLHVTSTFVDIYTILRMMKDVKTSPALSVAYFGDAHIRNISNILIKSGSYVKAFVSKEVNENRCIKYNLDQIDVIRDFKEHTQLKTKSLFKSALKSRSMFKSANKSRSMVKSAFRSRSMFKSANKSAKKSSNKTKSLSKTKSAKKSNY